MVLSHSGEKLRELVTAGYGVRKPQSVAYRHTDNTLVVGCMDENKLFLFKLKF